MEEKPLTDLTRSPQLNEAIQLGEMIIRGKGDPAEFKKSIKNLNTLRREMRSYLRREMKFHEKTSLLAGEAAKIESALEKMKKGIEEAYGYFKSGNARDIKEGLRECRSAFESLFRSFDRLKDEEDSKQGAPSSESPFQSELMRVGRGVIKGTIKPEAFRERLEGMKKAVRSFYEHFDSMRPNPQEQLYFEENQQAIRHALKKYVKALDEASLYFKDGDLHHIEKGLKNSNEASGEIIRHQKELMKAGEAQNTVLCLRCGTGNQVTMKFCRHCNAALPSFDRGAESTLELRMDDGGHIKDATHHVKNQFTEMLTGSVSKFRLGEITKEEFRRQLDEMERKAQHARREKEQLKPPKDLKTWEEVEYFEYVEKMMTTGIDDVIEGLGTIKAYIDSGDNLQLANGMETVLTGADKLYGVQMLSQGAERKS